MTWLGAWALAVGLALGLGLWMLASLAPRMNRPRLARRVAPYLVDVSAGARQSLAPPPPGPMPVLGIIVEPVSRRARALLTSLLGGTDLVARRLRQSGATVDVEAFRARQLGWGVAGCLAGVGVAVVAVGARGLAWPLGAIVVALFGIAGVVGCDLVLQRSARRRLARLAAELPVVLEFLTLSLSAGEGILDATGRVARVGRGELSRELAGVVASVSTGLPFAETLGGLARDLELPALTRCVEQILGALERGTPVVDALRAQAQDAREETKRSLLETAGRKEVAMLFPVVFLLLPVTIVFAIFPGIIVLQLGF